MLYNNIFFKMRHNLIDLNVDFIRKLFAPLQHVEFVNFIREHHLTRLYK